MISRVFAGFIVTLLILSGPATNGAAEAVPAVESLTLADAVERALAHYPAVGVAEAQADRAKAGVGEAAAAWFPSLSFSATATRYQEPMPVTPIHGFTPGSFPAFDKSVAQYGVSVRYTLFDGRRFSRVRQARLRRDAADAASVATRQAIFARVITAYITVLGKREVLTAHERRLNALKSELSRVQKFFDQDRAAKVEILRVEAALAAGDAERTRAQAALEVAERDLASLIGREIDETRADFLLPVQLLDQSVEVRDDLAARAKAANPTVEQARRTASAARAALSVARRAGWPRVDVVGNYFDQGDFNGNRVDEWNAGATLTIPFFTGGQIKKQIAGAKAGSRAAEESLRQAEVDIEQHIDRAMAALDETRSRVTSLAKAVETFAEVVKIEKLMRDTGAGTQTDYLDAEADLVNARANLVEAQHGEIAARVELARLTGQLDLEWIARYLENQP